MENVDGGEDGGGRQYPFVAGAEGYKAKQISIWINILSGG